VKLKLSVNVLILINQLILRIMELNSYQIYIKNHPKFLENF